MTPIRWRISGGLNRKEILAIHNAALRMIATVGIHVPSEDARRMLKGEQGVTIKDTTRVCITAERVTDLLGPWPKKPPASPFKTEFFVSGYSLRCYDLRTGDIRSPTAHDLVEFTKIAHEIGASGCALVMPKDMPQRLAEVGTYKLCLDVSDRVYGAGVYSDTEVFDFIQDLYRVIGKPYAVGMHMLSPMAFDPFLLDMAVRYIPRKAGFSIGNMPMQGATCPLQLPGAIAQSCAEVLGGAAIFRIIAPESEVSFAPFMYPFDMRHATIMFGGADFIMANLALAQVAAFYGTTIMGKAFNTMGKYPADAQMGYSAGAGLALMAMTGMRKFGWAGMCCIDEIASAEQMVAQHEIFRAVMHLINGFEFNANDLGEDVVAACAKDNSYMLHEKTVQNFRQQSFMSDIFTNEAFVQWDGAGRLDVRQKARQKALELLHRHSFRREPAQQRELDRLWKIAQERFI